MAPTAAAGGTLALSSLWATATMMRWRFLVLWLSLALASIAAVVPSVPPRRELPARVLIGYAHREFGQVRRAVLEDGVNVVIWAFLRIAPEVNAPTAVHRRGLSTAVPRVDTALDLGRIAALIADLDGGGHPVVHLASVGGWNGPHLSPSLAAAEWYAGWNASAAGNIFHGIDWDLEGNDDVHSPDNVFSVACLDKMGEISRLMKQDGFVVTLAPAQSYLNFASSNFSRYTNLTVPGRPWHSDFAYFGSNVYAYLLARFGAHVDLVSVQLYESYSEAAMAVYHGDMAADDYLYAFVRDLVRRGEEFVVDFDQDPSVHLASQPVRLPLDKLVLGLGNGWALHPASAANKVLYVSGAQCKEAYGRLQEAERPRGFMVWTLDERGTRGVYLARDIGEFLHAE